ncbi:class I SAM-dependent methyltransferase [Altererythrobacter arenosus]|uniref:Class I SAM-dependent methyltransferase n=1 Tax=Altererythrobacter arenosus TaxID=3032592 RepID=A0ABY8FQ83_9SPHN|nr:class I SAM-dependent methyltransferase [Altererythrobacter sp. CAU 1644]WFL77173.1 class I SAM-dependent methyltransferase [Altererythrobacter sp. CAU 1644]
MGLQGWYDRHVMPRLVTFACSQGQIMKRRSQVVPLATGDVFELGCGGGLNQEFYDTEAISSFSGIDPHGGLLEGARERARAKGWEVDIREGKGEAIPFSDSSFDTVVCTFTLCSVDEPAQVLGEMRRILKPGGRLLFLEHGRAPDPDVLKWQERIEPVWKRIGGGCHLTRPIGSAMRGAGFEVEPLGQGYLPKSPKFAAWNEWGIARKAGV